MSRDEDMKCSNSANCQDSESVVRSAVLPTVTLSTRWRGEGKSAKVFSSRPLGLGPLDSS